MLSKCRFLAFVKQMFLFGLLVFLTAALNTTPCQASAGDLDPTFGDGGLVVTDIEGKAAAGLTQILLKTDGKIIGTSGGWYLLRFNADGTLDDTFGDEGVKSTFGKFLELEQDGAPQVVALQPDGRILVGGYKRTLIGVICNGGCHEKFTRDFHLARFNGDGTLDTTFGTNGRVTTDFSHLFGPLYAELAQISMISIQEDGKIVAVGSSETRVSEYDPNVWNVALVRYNTDGTLDTTFGTGGIAIPDLGIEQPRSEDMVLQSDGKIVVAGNAKDDYGSNLGFLVRYNSNGTVDNTFDTDGIVVPSISSSSSLYSAEFHSVTLQPDGKILAAGDGNAYPIVGLAVFRFNPDGSSDITFGTEGWVITDFGSSSNMWASARTAVIQSDSKIIAMGELNTYVSPEVRLHDFALARYNPDGSLDTTFGLGGTVVTEFESRKAFPHDMVLLPYGKIIIGGYLQTHPPDNHWTGDMLLVRYNADGALDAGFGTDGTMTLSMMAPTDNEGLDIIANQGDGKFLVGGKSNQMYTEWDFTITRHNADGSLDTTFGKDGWVTTDFSPDHDQTHTFFLVSRDYLTAIAVQPDGKILAVGWSMLYYYGYYEKTAVVLARYLPDGSLDDSFGVGGRILRYIENLYSVNDIAVQSDGKIVAVGSVEDEFLLIRFSPDGSPDETFGNSGIVLSNFFMGPWPNYEEANAVVLQSDGKILVAGYVWVLLSPTDMDRWTLARYNPDGSLDMSFGQGGVVGTFLKPYAYDLALQPDGKILVTGSSKDGYASPTGEDFTLLRYLPDGSLDSTFGTEGMVFTDFGTETFGWSRNETAKSVALQPDGRIVVAGQVVEFLEPPDGDPINAIPNNNFGLVRYNQDGSLDYTFGDSGKVMTEFGSRQEGAEAVTIQNDGKILVVGSSSQRFRGKDMEIAIARYDAIGPVTIADIQEFFGTVVENGYLYGEGGVMCDAECSLARMSQLLESAAWYIERDRHLLACSALRRAHRRSDGESDRILTRDLVNGEAREWLAAMIERLMNDLGCRLF